MASNLIIRDDVGATVAAGTFAGITGALPVTPTTAIHREIFNDDTGGSVDDAIDVRIVPSGYYTAVGAPFLGEKGTGMAALDVRSFEYRILAGVAGNVLQDWRRFGFGAAPNFGTIASGDSVHTEWRVNLPLAAGSAAFKAKLEVIQRASTYLAPFPATGGNGILRNVGRGDFTSLFSASTTVGVSGIGTLTAPDYVYAHLGTWKSVLGGGTSGVHTLDANDSAPAALASGEEYPYYLTLGASGRTITKGLKGTAPLTYPDDWPALPTDEIVEGYGTRHFSSNLSFTSLRSLGFLAHSVSSLDVTYQGGDAVVDDSLVQPSSPQQITLTDSSTATVWLLPDRSLEETTDGAKPTGQPGALKLTTFTTSGGAVTATVDERSYREQMAERVVAQWQSPASAATHRFTWVNPTGQQLAVRPDQLELRVDFGTGTSGSVTGEIYTKPSDGSETTSFTSKGSDDRRPSIAYNAGSDLALGVPEALEVAPGEALILEIVIATDMAPDWVSLSVVLDPWI